MFKKKIIIVGAGGHAKSVIDIIEELEEWRIIGLIGKEEELGKQVSGYKVLGTDRELKSIRRNCKDAFIGIGQIKDYRPRTSIGVILDDLNFTIPIIKAKNAYVSKRSCIQRGTLICNGSVVNSGAHIGEHTIINTGAIIEHDSIIGSYTHVSTGTIVNGGVVVGEKTFIGSRSMVREGVIVPECSIIRAGSVVMK